MSQQAIAIVGMAGRFPSAPSIDALWTLLREGREGVRPLSSDEIDADAAFTRRPNYVAAQGILDDEDQFDPEFFGFTPGEAEEADPQQRVFLECAWEALEDAGYTPKGLKDVPVGVYAGSGPTMYGLRRLLTMNGPCVRTMQSLLGCDKDYLATRASYKLGLTGPSHAIASACSTSLVAVALACEQLLDYTVDMALAGAAHLTFPQRTGYLHEDGGILSSDGHCRPFDARADGTVPSNGAGIVVLKRLEDAVADGDFVWAVIRGFAVNNDGDDKVGYTAPSIGGQMRVITKALAAAGVSPDDISYVEAHGTGTAIGDPIEVAALTEAYARRTRRQPYCAIGSIKSNLGHLNTASGVAGLIKCALALHHQAIPPSLHFERPNPRIDFSASPFFVNTTLRPWTGDSRFAGVSSFGFGGTNVHLILGNAPLRSAAPPAREVPHVLPLSARSPAALAGMSARLHAHLSSHPAIDLGAVAATLQSGRTPFPHRRAVVCATVDEAVAALAMDAGPGASERTSDRPPPIVFMFPGQGSQRPGAGRELYEREPVFRQTVDSAASRLHPLIGCDVRELIVAPEIEDARLADTALAQPALFVFQVAMAQMLRAMGLEPAAAIGHSVGEIAAAFVAGVFDLDGAAALIAARSRLMQEMPRGAMLSVFAGSADVARLLPAGVEITGFHGPALCVVGGPEAEVLAVQAALAGRDIRATRLSTSHAFHTAAMEPIRTRLAAAAAGIASRPPAMPVLSCATGDWHPLGTAIPASAWAEQVRSPVQLDRGLRKLFTDFPGCLAIETGPGQTLTYLAQSHPQRPATARFVAAAGPGDAVGTTTALRRAVARAFVAGARVNFAAVRGTDAVTRVPLPTYPFERRRCWMEQPLSAARAAPQAPGRVNAFVEVLD